MTKEETKKEEKKLKRNKHPDNKKEWVNTHSLKKFFLKRWKRKWI